MKTNVIGYERTTLGQLWDAYAKGKFTGASKLAVEEIFRASTVRVPMDSISGVQVLKFGGFTGREGHGILMHSKAMRAEGGADLDGDKSFFFFGGKGGWKKEWKDAYDSNKSEHYSKDGKSVSDNKDATIDINSKYSKYGTYSNLLSQEFTPAQEKMFNSKAFQYAPGERIRISEAAVNGRNLLGPAVVQKQVMTAAYNSIVAGGGEDVLQFEKWHKKKKYVYEVKVKAKTDEASQESQRKMGRAQLGLASDPLDVLGLKNKNEWFTYLWDTHFTISSAKKRLANSKRWIPVSGKEKDKIINLESVSGRQLKSGILKDYYDINSAYWGKNWAEGRKYSMSEINELGSAIYNINENPNRVNNALAKTGELLHGQDWSDSIFGRLDKAKVEAMYKQHQDDVSQFDWMKALLGRSSFKTPMGNYIANTMKYSLWKDGNVYNKNTQVLEGGLDGVANSTTLFTNAVKGTLFGKNKKLIADAIKNPHKRRPILEKISNLAEDFIVNDMTDLTAMTNASRIIKNMIIEGDIGLKGARNIEDAIDTMNKKIQYLKKRSYLMSRDRANLEVNYSPKEESIGPDGMKLQNTLLEIAFGTADLKKLTSKDRKRIREIGDDITAEIDQGTIDLKIEKFKTDLTDRGKLLFDQLLLGSLDRYDLNKIDNFIARIDKFDKTTMDIVHNMRSQAARTRTSKLGFNSSSVTTESLKDHLGTYLGLYKDMWKPRTTEEVNKASDKLHADLEKPEVQAETKMPDDALNRFMQESLMESGYMGLKEAPLDAKSKTLASEIATLIKSWGNNKLGQNLDEVVRNPYVVGKQLNAMNYQDFVRLRNYLQEAKRGNFIQRWFKKLGPTDLDLRHWMQIPETVGRELMRDDLQLMKQHGFFTDRYGNPREGMIMQPTNYVDMANNWLSLMVEKSTGGADRAVRKFQDSVQFHTGTEEAGLLWNIAVRQRELGLKHALLKEKDPTRKAEIQTILKYLNTKFNEADKAANYTKELKNKKFFVTVDGVRQERTGEWIVNKLNDSLTETFKSMHRFIRGEPGALDDYIIGYWDGKDQLSPKIDYKKFIRHMNQHMTGGMTPWKTIARSDVPDIFGIDGLRAVARSMQLDLLPRKTKKQREIRARIAKQPVLATGKIDFRYYFPHMFFDKKVALKGAKEAALKIMQTPDSEMSKDQKEIELKKIQYRTRSLEGDFNFKDMEEYEMFDSLVERMAKGKRISESRVKWFNANERAGSMHSRNSYTFGWSIDPSTVEAYIRSLNNTYYRQLSQMFSRDIIDRMGKEMPKKWGKEQAKAWQNWMKLYVNDAIGNPTIIPEAMYQDPTMKLKMSPYGWFADNKVRDRINKIADMLGLTNKKLPKELRGIDVDTVRHWSNIEGQYEMASLLAHPKSMVMNVLGGNLHTIQSAGLKNFINARRLDFLSKINPKWNNKQAIDNFITGHGVVPEYLLYEMGMHKAFQTNKGKDVLADIKSALMRDPNMDAAGLKEVVSKHGKGWWEKSTQFAAKFMTIPERALRRDAFMAHYIQAWEKFGGAVKDYNHPFLIEMAKKGVKATQFLYNAPNRPAFARTALGKVLARFQLYAWNSVKLRNEVNRQARIAGYAPGSPEYQRYKRFFILDMFMLMMANTYSYSLFETNLPQPWGWFQDTSEWLLGDEEERDRAFYGNWPVEIAPLQAVLPPGLRLVGPTFKALIEDDWSRMAGYHMWNAFPFGRLAKDIVGPYNIIDQPSRIPEKFFGIPMTQIQRQRTAANRAEAKKLEEQEKQEQEDLLLQY